ncbi:MAG: hypothetical protein M1825_006520 [Sarcosagium campestre]|nr:MAG: hypothetical protein M1825_006520 [Sarcosagium campestre]
MPFKFSARLVPFFFLYVVIVLLTLSISLSLLAPHHKLSFNSLNAGIRAKSSHTAPEPQPSIDHAPPAAAAASSPAAASSTVPAPVQATEPELESESDGAGRQRVVALVFFGRRDRVSILDCYLKENLVSNGGILDEVQFVAKTEDKEDLKWLDKAVAGTVSYTKISIRKGEVGASHLLFANAYDALERNTLYVKIDDDVIFIGKDSLRSLVQTKRDHPEYFMISANVVNSPVVSWIHYHLGVVHPFLPELKAPEDNSTDPSNSWRTSELPVWNGPDGFKMTLDTLPPFKGHRWLPLGKGQNTDATPIALTEYAPHGPGWNKWAIAAQEHYSLLKNVEDDPELKRYKFPIWETVYLRLSINFIVFSGDDILDNGKMPDGDEEYLSVILPKKLGRHVAIDGSAVVAHYSFGAQLNDGPAGIGWTDVLDRYRAYADEMVCPSTRGHSK